jgi:hypothetical protein
MLIPWSEIVNIKQASDASLLKSVEMYIALSIDNEQTPESREMAADLAERYKRLYLGIEPKGNR